MKKEFSVARRREMGERRRSRFYEHAPGGIFSSRKFFGSFKGDGNVVVHLLLFLSSTLPLLREERTSDPEIPTYRCGYWTLFLQGELRRSSSRVGRKICQDHVTILFTGLYFLPSTSPSLSLSLSRINLKNKVHLLKVIHLK